MNTRFSPFLVRIAAVVVVAFSGVACTSPPQREAEWIDPAIGMQSRMLRGEKVLVACDAYDATLRQICLDQLVREVEAHGVSAITVPAGTVLLNDRELDGQLVSTAAALEAKAVFTMTLTPATTSVGSGVSLGLGAFSFGGGAGGGVGLSMPLGGGGATTGFAANGRVTAVESRRLVWAATAVSAPTADLAGQMFFLSRSLLASARGAGLF